MKFTSLIYRCVAAGLCGALILLVGCRMPGPLGAPTQPRPLGSVVDEANRIQEENAEYAKLIVYVHEFELNQIRKRIDAPWTRTRDNTALDNTALDNTALANQREIRGVRLNEYGMEHLKRIARQLQSGSEHVVTVERSESSKHWNTLHHYPVHFNEQLDEQRRQVVVAGLEALGIDYAEELVIVAPAYVVGQQSGEAAQAFTRAFGAGGGQGSGPSGGQR